MTAALRRRHAFATVFCATLRIWIATAAPRVGLTALPRDHAFANIRLTDNIVQFSTKRYSATIRWSCKVRAPART